jgi:heat shock protein HslJ
MTGYSRPWHAGLRAALAASAIIWVAGGCSTKAKGAKPQVQASPAVVAQRQRPHADATNAEEVLPLVYEQLPFTGAVWEWLGNLTPTETMKVTQPATYLLEFKPDGWFNVQTDCNRGEGMYEISDQRIAMAVVKLADASCPPGSHHELYLKSLESAGRYRMSGQKLYFDMKGEAKTMVFWRRK